jgi:hypothetical protein
VFEASVEPFFDSIGPLPPKACNVQYLQPGNADMWLHERKARVGCALELPARGKELGRARERAGRGVTAVTEAPNELILGIRCLT